MGREMFHRLHKLKYRIQISFAILIILAEATLGVIFYNVMKRELVDYAHQTISLSIVETIKTLDYFYGTYMSKTDMLFVDQALMNLISSIGDPPSVDEQKRINDILGMISLDLRYPEVQSTYYFGGTPIFRLYSPSLRNNTIYLNIYPYDAIENEAWFLDLHNNVRMFTWIPKCVIGGTEYAGFNRKLVDTATLAEKAILQTLIPVRKIKNVIEQNLYLNVETYAYLDGRSVIASSGDGAAIDCIVEGEGNDIGIFERRIGGKDLIFCSNVSELNGFRLVYTLPKEVVYSRIGYFFPLILMYIFITVVIAILSGSKIATLITRRIKILKETTSGIANGNFLIRADVSGKDEIAKLAEHFNIMVDKIIQLTREQYTSQIRIKEIKGELLQEQLNPHLLYNTLAVARITAARSGMHDMFKLFDDMINYYKRVLNRGQIISTVRSEIMMIRHYLSIVESVYKLNLATEYLIDEEVYDCWLIKLLLQPIVENAVMHGLKGIGGGRLAISGQIREKVLRLSVRDEGSGMDPDVLKDVRRCMDGESSEASGFGISNVVKRMRLFFPTCGFNVESVHGEWTEVSIDLPSMGREEMQAYMQERNLEF
jgi:sensor histidine kinase YesM